MSERLPARLEVSALIRRAEAAGGFAVVLHKGEPDSGAILVVILHKGQDAQAWEPMPRTDGARRWQCSRRQAPDDTGEFADYLARRRKQDPDLWMIELDIAEEERFTL